MPKRLLDRCRPDSISEFRRAAQQRFQDGAALARAGRRTAAIYLWDYAAEMTLKSAYFDLIGFPSNQVITLGDLKGAKANGAPLGFTWSGNLHNLESWAQLLVLTRASIPGWAYADADFGSQVAAKGRQLQRSWSEILRYHKNVAYGHEANGMMTATQWLLLHSSQL